MCKIVASHQPHFFPWLGYLDKMAKSDLFLINDVAQIELQSPMTRNRIIDRFGNVKYISCSIDKEGYITKRNSEVKIKDWTKKRISLLSIIKDAYYAAPYWREISPYINSIIKADYTYIIDLQMATVTLLRDLLCVNTPIKFHSELVYNEGNNVSERIAQKIYSVNGNVYLSGVGAKKYMDESEFEKLGIKVVYQEFVYPEYKQIHSETFIPNMSAIDMLFNCGIKNSKEMFWKNIR